MKTWQAATGVLLVTGLLQSTSFAQSTIGDQLNPLNPDTPGLHIADVSLSSSYFSESVQGASALGLPSGGRLGQSASMLEGSAAFTWSKIGQKSSFSASYSPSYLRQFTASDYHAFNQSLRLSATRKLSSALTLAGSFQWVMSDFTQSLFAPTLYGGLSSVPATFDELASALLTGQSGNPGLSQLLAGASLTGAPQTAFLYGGRDLSTAASISLNYAQSTRSSFNLSVQAMRTQFTNAGSSGSNIGPAYVIPVTTGASASLGWSYLLTSRTTVTANVSSSRALSKFADAYATQFSGSVGRTLSTHWFVQAMFGFGFITPVGQTFAPAHGASPEFGGSVGYKFKAQTLLGAYTRTVSDSYGLGAQATESGTGGWSWNRPGSSISLSGNFGYSHLTGTGTPNVTGWTSQVSFARKLQSQLFTNVSYSYARYPEAIILGAPSLTFSGLMVGLSWSPSMRR